MTYDVAIIGAGASGVLVAAHLHRREPSLRVAIVDAGARAARGLAYGTPYGAHLLNVPAARMSAFIDDADDFTKWLAAKAGRATGREFAPRALYGEYLAEVLGRACEPPSTTARVFGTAVGLTRTDGGPWHLHLQDGRIAEAHVAILALGNLAPSDPLRLGDRVPDNYLRDPWAPGSAHGLAADAPVVIIGSGLTMVDVVLALRAEGHRGTIHAISRHGLLPFGHAAHLPRTIGLPAAKSPRAALRWIREEARTAAKDGADWRAVMDALRPMTQSIWQSWTGADRAAFMRHLRAYWDIHRHRAAPEVAAEVAALIDDGTLTVHAGRITALREAGDQLAVDCVLRHSGAARTFLAARVINCTGPASDYSSLDLPLVAQLRRSGWLVADPLRLGVETDADGRLLGADGEAVPGLFTIGPLRRPALWESTAIPEIRAQAAALAELLPSEVARRESGRGWRA